MYPGLHTVAVFHGLVLAPGCTREPTDYQYTVVYIDPQTPLPPGFYVMLRVTAEKHDALDPQQHSRVSIRSNCNPVGREEKTRGDT